MKKQTINKFTEGLVTDLNPLTTPPTVLTEARNVDFITTSDNQIILQKRQGNGELVNDGEPVKLSDGFKPLALKEYNDVVYIICYNEETGEGEIGTYPSPDWEKLKYTEGDVVDATVDITYTYNDGHEFDGYSHTLTPDYNINEVYPIRACVTYIFTLTNTGVYPDIYDVTINNETLMLESPDSLDDISLDPGESIEIVTRLNTKYTTAIDQIVITATSQLTAENLTGANVEEAYVTDIEVEEVYTDIEDKSYLYDVEYSADVEEILSSTCSDEGSSTLLTDSTVDFTTSGVQVDHRIKNLTDGSWAKVVTVNQHSLVTTTLEGGTYNVWYQGDSYVIDNVTCPITSGTKVPVTTDVKMTVNFVAESAFFGTGVGLYIIVYYTLPGGGTGSRNLSVIDEETTACYTNAQNQVIMEGPGKLTFQFQPKAEEAGFEEYIVFGNHTGEVNPATAYVTFENTPQDNIDGGCTNNPTFIAGVTIVDNPVGGGFDGWYFSSH